MWRTRHPIRAALAAAVVCVALPAAAQEGKRPVEMFVGADGVMSWAGDGSDIRVGAAIPRGDRLSFEFFGGNYRAFSAALSYDVNAIYGFQVRQRILRGMSPGVEPFLTYGALGAYGRTICSPHPCQPAQPKNLTIPGLGLFGVGVQHAIGSHVAVRVEAQGGFFFVIPVGVRLAAAIAIPFGRFPAETGAR